jgi:hypothetical protein
MSRESPVIIGAGPAGLTAAYELGKRGLTSTVLEAGDQVETRLSFLRYLFHPCP